MKQPKLKYGNSLFAMYEQNSLSDAPELSVGIFPIPLGQ
jgi:hypothetical protein